LGLRPLDDIATTAGAIAQGDLSRRVARDEPTTEIGRLGGALNGMLGQIEVAFAERQASEDRLRRFVADASHELRTPLTSIRAYAELFGRGADRRPDDLGRVLHGIEGEADRMAVLIDDLLLLARLDQGRPLAQDPVDLGALAAEAVEAARAIDGSRPVQLSVVGSVEVGGDRARLRQVLDNLLGNVRVHTPPGTAAVVTVSATGRTAVLSVADDGPGLRGDEAARVFERFYRADRSRSRDGGGTGLGLAIVAAIAEAHGGRASAEGRPQGGALFRVELPLLVEEKAAAGPGPPAAVPPRTMVG
ncbi:MAG: HAMP domain-containing histidine kinase, partial [Actinobacteria bacterium]|nr:HAMP domain-containing histidine kinase [Actinomycetota bacterium]